MPAQCHRPFTQLRMATIPSINSANTLRFLLIAVFSWLPIPPGLPVSVIVFHSGLNHWLHSVVSAINQQPLPQEDRTLVN